MRSARARRSAAFPRRGGFHHDEGKRFVAEGERGPLWIVAGRQTTAGGALAGNGFSTPGNLHASLVLSGGSIRASRRNSGLSLASH